MSNINYINNHTIAIMRDEIYEHSTHKVEYDATILKLINKIYMEYKVKYIFIIIQHKPTKIKFTEYHDLYGKKNEYININHNSSCIII